MAGGRPGPFGCEQVPGSTVEPASCGTTTAPVPGSPRRTASFYRETDRQSAGLEFGGLGGSGLRSCIDIEVICLIGFLWSLPTQRARVAPRLYGAAQASRQS